MDKNKLKDLGIEESDLSAIQDALEELQNDLENRIDKAESNGNEARKKELEGELSEVEALLVQVKEEKASQKEAEKAPGKKEAGEKGHGAIPVVVEEEPKHTIPTALDPKDELKDAVADKLNGIKGLFGAHKKDSKASDSEEGADTSKAGEEASLDKEHEKKLKAQAEAIRKNAAQKAEEEKEATESELEAEEAVKASATSGSELTDLEKKLDEAVIAYAAGNKTEAFSKFYDVANLGDDYHMADDRLGEAQKFLGLMYKKGEGTTADVTRGVFWLEKASKLGNVEACLILGQYYADLKPKSPEEETKNRNLALKYFKTAGMKDNQVGKDKFVEICLRKKDQVSSADIKTACKFLEETIAKERDEFVRQKLSDDIKTLKEKKPRVKGARKRNTNEMFHDIRDIFASAGSVLSLYGVMLLGNHVLANVDTILNFDRWIPEHFKEIYPAVNIGPDILQEFGRLDPVGYWGMLFLLLGYLLAGFSKVEVRGKFANLLCEISLYASAIIGFLIYYVYSSRFGYGDLDIAEIWAIVCLLLCILAAQIPGKIYKYFFD